MRILFFKASWCSACSAIDQYVPADIERIDCEVQSSIAAQYNVVTLPLFIIVDDDNKEVDRLQTTNMPQLNNWIQKTKQAFMGDDDEECD